MPQSFCPSCGQPVDLTLAERCSHCGRDLGQEATAGDGGPQAEARSSVPFEDPSKPFGLRIWETVSMAFTNPIGLFSNMPSQDLGPPLLYGVIIGTVGALSGLVWQFMFGGLASLAEPDAARGFALTTGFLIIFAILSPAFVLVGLFISAGIYHLMLLLLGAGQRGFGVTFRAVAYGSTPGLLGIVPICGGIVGGIWVVVLTIIGAIYGHRTDGWRAIVAYFLPMVLCCGLLFVLLMMAGFIGAMAD